MYSKSDKENISQQERNELKRTVPLLVDKYLEDFCLTLAGTEGQLLDPDLLIAMQQAFQGEEYLCKMAQLASHYL